MLSNGVHHDTECQDVTTHDEDGEQQLAGAEELTSKCTQQNLTSVGKVLNVRILLMELRNNIASIGSKETQADNQDNSPIR
jgi:hypothetical protein